jgi:hypothetical protein
MDVGPDLNAIYIDLLLFTEETAIQYLTNSSRADRRKIELVFAMPLTDSFNYRFFKPGPLDREDVIEYYSPRKDSLILWLTDSTVYKLDTLAMEISYVVKDTAGLDMLQTDSLRFTFRERVDTKRRGAKEVQAQQRMQLSTLRRNGTQELNRDLALTLDLPLKEIHDSLISFFRMEDSVEVPAPFYTYADSLVFQRGWIHADWRSDSKYRLVLLPGALQSFYPLQHDTVDVQFKTRDMEYYGQILLNLEQVRDPVLIQLISKDKVVREQVIETSGQYIFSFLVPQEYRIKFIHDLNRNGKWDTGKYIKHLQPEPVEFLPGTITLRSNWDHEVTVRLER